MLKTRLSAVGIAVAVTIGAMAGLFALVIGGDNGRNDTVLHANPSRIPASWLAYRNGERGLRLRYPPSWHVAPTNLTPCGCRKLGHAAHLRIRGMRLALTEQVSRQLASLQMTELPQSA